MSCCKLRKEDCGNYYFLCGVIHAHYLPVSKPDVMFLCFVYNSVYMSFVTHLVWCSLYVLLFRACQVSIIIFQDFVKLGPRACVLTTSQQQYYRRGGGLASRHANAPLLFHFELRSQFDAVSRHIHHTHFSHILQTSINVQSKYNHCTYYT